MSQGGFEDFLGVEILAQVHIENPKCLGAHSFQEGLDRGSRNGASLGERSQANGVSARSEIPEVLVEADVVPSNLGENFVGGLAVLEGHIHAPGGMVGVGLDMGVRQVFRGEDLADFRAVGVRPNGAYGMSRGAELAAVVTEIQRRAAEFFAFGEDIPKYLPDSDNDRYAPHFPSGSRGRSQPANRAGSV